MSLDSVREILANRQFGSLLGLNEDLWFEAKQRTAYDLDTPTGRYELAKDVCAFANSEGGFLLLGLNTDPLIELHTDRVVSLNLFPRTEFDVSQYEGVIREYVYPTIDQLKVAWIPDASHSDVGLGVIEIPLQNSERKYFLTANVVESSQTIRQIVFGLSRRNESSNDPMSVKELHSIMQKGKSKLSETLTRLEEKVDVLFHSRSAPPTSTASSSQQLSKRIDELFKESTES